MRSTGEGTTPRTTHGPRLCGAAPYRGCTATVPADRRRAAGRRKMCVPSGNTPRSSRTNSPQLADPILLVLGQRLGEHGVDGGRQLRLQCPGARYRALQVGGDARLVVRGVTERWPPGQHLERRAGERVDVGPTIERLGSGDLLGRGVIRRAEEHPRGPVSPSSIFAIPNSTRYAVRGVSVILTITLAGLTSRWIAPRL